MKGANEFLRLLEAGDAGALMKAWKRVAPQLPQPKDRAAAEITMHMARTASEMVSMRARLYSHDWLLERMLPSQLPTEYVPPVEAVGISVNFGAKFLQPAALEVQGAMEDAVNECYADGKTQVPFVRQRMHEARDKTLKALFGRH